MSEVDSFKRPYAEAGHDMESLFKPGGVYRCATCGSALIDLAEDLGYGDMTKCISSAFLQPLASPQ